MAIEFLSSFTVLPTKSELSDEPSLNAKLLEKGGYVRKLMSGVYTFLPLGVKVLNKIENLVRQEMLKLGAFELLMPALHPKELWQQTGRWDSVDVLFKLKAASDKDLCLGPTHEEVVTPLLKEFGRSYKKFPFCAFQIQTKFRNELRPKSGLLRCREFRMKDLYSFHTSQECLDEFYERVKVAYFKIFNSCGLEGKVFLTFASGGIFSDYSHEFQAVTDRGEDDIYLCEDQKFAINEEIFEQVKNRDDFKNLSFRKVRAIEVGNIFKLGTKFSNAFNFSYTAVDNTEKEVLMGCYGLGTSRLLGAIVEVCSDGKSIVWPKSLAPYLYTFILLQPDLESIAKKLRFELLEAQPFDCLIDDRLESAGSKFNDADLIGSPIVVIVGEKFKKAGVLDVKNRARNKSKEFDLQSFTEAIFQDKFLENKFWD